MSPNLPTRRELAAYFLAAQHPLTRQWVDDDVRLDLLAEERADDLLLATDREVAAERARRFAPDQPAEMFLNRWVSVKDGLLAMVSMRYEGGDADKPFVDATVLSRPLSVGDLSALAEVGTQVYGSFVPRYIRLWSAEPPGYFPGCLPDRRFVAGPVEALAAGVGEPIPSELALARAGSMRNFDAARGAYDAMARNHPAHVTQATLCDYEDLQECLVAGSLFDIIIDGGWAGYVAVKRGGETLGMPGYVVHELIMTAKARGCGYGRHLATMLARTLQDKTGVLIGTIHADNRGAQEAAAAAGRVDVGGWLQVPLEGHSCRR